MLQILLSAIILLTYVPHAHAIKSRYVTLKYPNQQVLKEFNDNLRLPRSLSQRIKRRNVVTVEDQVISKIDFIVEKVEIVLDMFPDNLKFNLVLLPTRKDVAQVFYQNYGKKVNHIAYYSLSQKTIYISVDDTKLRVIAHEIGHMVVDHFFDVRPPYKVHELMAQYAELHVTD